MLIKEVDHCLQRQIHYYILSSLQTVVCWTFLFLRTAISIVKDWKLFFPFGAGFFNEVVSACCEGRAVVVCMSVVHSPWEKEDSGLAWNHLRWIMMFLFTRCCCPDEYLGQKCSKWCCHPHSIQAFHAKKGKIKKIIQVHKLYCIYTGTKQGITFCRMKIPVYEDKKICSILQNLILKNQNQTCVGFLFWSLASYLFLPLTWIFGSVKVTFGFVRKRWSVMQKL